MKPKTWRSSSFGSILITLASTSAYAADIFWDGTVNPGSWADATNWSTTSSATGANPAAPPGSGDIAVFTVSPISTAQSINLNGDQSVLGIRTANQTSLSTLLGGGVDRTLSIGASGIIHSVGASGALSIGSNTVGQKVNISLTDSQTWTSSVTGGTLGAVALKIYNGVSLGVSGAKTLTLDGVNTGTEIFGSISDGAGTLSLTKNGSSVSVWNLTGTNTYTGLTTINGGTLRYSSVNSFAGLSTPGATIVNSGGTIDLRAYFTDANLNSIINNTTFNTGSNLMIDTSNGSRSVTTNITSLQNFTKSGSSTLTLTGTNSYTGNTNITGGTLFAQSAAALPGAGTAGKVSVSNGANLQIRNGGTGFSNSQIDSILANTTWASGAGIIVANNNENFNYSGIISGAKRFGTTGTNTTTLSGLNTYDGATSINQGSLLARTISSVGGGASNLGAPTTIANGQINIGESGNAGRLIYLGGESANNRALRFSGSTGGATIDSSGTGALSFGTISGADGSKTITLTGSNTGNNTLSGSINNYGTGTTALNKRGSGTWVLSGNNGFTGGIQTSGGKLIIDQSGGNDPLAASAGLTMVGGHVEFKGATAGTNDVSTGALTLSNNTFNKITVDQSAGGSSSWTFANLTGTAGASGGTPAPFYLDRSSGANLALTSTIAASDSSASYTMRIANGLVMTAAGSSSTGWRATNFVTDSTGTGYMMQNGSNQLVRYTGYSNVGTSTDDIIGNHAGDVSNAFTTSQNLLMNGSVNRTASLNFSTLLMDTTAGAITLNMGANNLASSVSNGRSLLVSGNNDATITSSSGVLSNSLYMTNSGTGKLTLDMTLAGSSVTLVTAGPGLVNFTKNVLGDLNLNGNTLQLTKDQNYSTVGTLRINQAVLEIGADLADADGGSDFNRRVSGSIGTIIMGDSGFSALGADRTVNLGLAAAADGGVMTWGAGGFLVTNNTTRLDGEFSLKLGSATSTHTLNFQNAIDLNGLVRNVDVGNGTNSSNIDARLNGELSNGGLIKSGTGTLELAANNTYTGVTELRGGKTIVSGAINSSTAITVNGATLQLGAANALNDFAAMTLENATLDTAGFSDSLGVLTIKGDNILNLGTAASIVAFADSSSAVWGSTLSILNWTGNLLGGGTDQVVFGTDSNGITSSQLASISFLNPTGYSSGTYAASILSSGEIVPMVIPEVSQSLLAAFGTALLAFRRKRA